MIIERIAKDLVRSLDMKILLVIAFAIGLSACGPIINTGIGLGMKRYLNNDPLFGNLKVN